MGKCLGTTVYLGGEYLWWTTYGGLPMGGIYKGELSTGGRLFVTSSCNDKAI